MNQPAVKLTIPAEWSRHQAVWTAWPSHADLWRDDLDGARQEVAAMVRALAPEDSVRILACGMEALTTAKQALRDVAEIIPAQFGDIWLRDTGPVFALAAGQCAALRFANNGWGGKYILPGDKQVGDLVASAAGIPMRHYNFILEGGALEHNGRGWILTTRQCLLNPNRNPGWNESRAHEMLAAALGCTRLLWLDRGLENDHTDGHVDNLARFVDAGTVVCQHAAGGDDPNACLYEKVAVELEAMGLKVHRIPSPGRVLDNEGRIMPASHMNFFIGNATVVVPVYNEPYGQQAVAALQTLFPGRRVTGLPSRHLLGGGGSFHCITRQQPVSSPGN